MQVIFGESRNNEAAAQLIQGLGRGTLDGSTLWVGYPVLASPDEPVVIDALLLSPEYGVVVFYFSDQVAALGDLGWGEAKGTVDDLYVTIQTRLQQFKELRRGRELVVPIQAVLVLPGANVAVQIPEKT